MTIFSMKRQKKRKMVSYYWDFEDAQTKFIAVFECYREIYGDPMLETEDGMYAAEYISADEKTAIGIVLINQLYLCYRDI